MRKNSFIIQCFFLLVAVLLSSPALSFSAHRKLPVLVYHHLEDPVKSDVSCSPRQFQNQMQALLNAEFTPISLRDARLFLVGGLRQVANPLLITFDDGYESLYFHALPVARQLKIPMVIFMITARVACKPQFIRYLSEIEMKEMVKSGFIEFGSHSNDLHTDILRIYGAFSGHPNPLLRQITCDLQTSYNRLISIVGRPPVAIAWPYGKFNAALQGEARKIGYLLHFTSKFGYNEPGSDPLHLKRIPISSRDTPISVVKKARGVVR